MLECPTLLGIVVDTGTMRTLCLMVGSGAYCKGVRTRERLCKTGQTCWAAQCMRSSLQTGRTSLQNAHCYGQSLTNFSFRLHGAGLQSHTLASLPTKEYKGPAWSVAYHVQMSASNPLSIRSMALREAAVQAIASCCR